MTNAFVNFSTAVKHSLIVGDYDVTVRATDVTDYTVFSEATLSVRVYDSSIVEEYPTYEKTYYEATVKETVQAGHAVINVHADTPGADPVLYYFDHVQEPYSLYFDIVEDTVRLISYLLFFLGELSCQVWC